MRRSTRTYFAFALLQCWTISIGCGTAVSPEQAALKRLEADGKASGSLGADGHVVSLSSHSMTDDAAKQLTAFPALTTLALTDSPIGDAHMGVIGALTQLESLALDHTQVTDAGLQSISSLEHLRELNLAGCSVTDGGLGSLAGLTELTSLNLNDTQINGLGLVYLSKLNRLEALYLQNTVVDFESIPPLSGLESLKILHLAGTKTGGGIVRAITGLPSLERLYLNGTSIKDEDIPALAAVLAQNCPHFKGLFVEKTALSDAALEPMHPLADLKEFTLIHVHGTKVTKDGVVRLRKLLPEANVVSQH
ncbi:leucine-rich repeat domain-containing protein [Schlesneria paludicola]|uniref:leucine-rich repeat domain-containing protein n=1 Tax=Schlesneria paludicola TaxID=360056 RepID=UPI00029AC357|nr:leucine-rich repeat-containing protein [Schlesneria paludicola]